VKASKIFKRKKAADNKKALFVMLVLFLIALAPVLAAGANQDKMPGGTQTGRPGSHQETTSYSDAGVSAPVEAAGYYKVLQGDTLSGIARKLGLAIVDIAMLNSLESRDFIVEGQLLRVPGGIISHLVREGETLWSISERYRVPLKELACLNSLADENLLPAGEELIIPAPVREDSYYPISRGQVSGVKLSWPVAGWISSPFGMRDGRPHEGIDLAANQGEPIKAARSGRVVYSDSMGTYGLTVIVDHGDGMSTLYAHASSLLVIAGDRVDEGQTIALVGNTGRSTGPHLHLEVRYHGQPLDPLLFLNSMYA
jgi:murein DD-endopeptidase MepM/ murein hydrolase activator NlpD